VQATETSPQQVTAPELASELLACAIEGEPLPLPRTLAGAISPRRFLS